MPLRIDCDLPGQDGVYVEFRDDRWTFGDRRRILEAPSDLDVLETIVPYIIGWHVTSTSGDILPAPKSLDGLDEVDDLVVGWLVRAWLLARNKRSQLPNG